MTADWGQWVKNNKEQVFYLGGAKGHNWRRTWEGKAGGKEAYSKANDVIGVVQGYF